MRIRAARQEPKPELTCRAAVEDLGQYRRSVVVANDEVIPSEQVERYRQMARGGRPRLGDGESVQIRARVAPEMANALDQLAADAIQPADWRAGGFQPLRVIGGPPPRKQGI